MKSKIKKIVCGIMVVMFLFELTSNFEISYSEREAKQEIKEKTDEEAYHYTMAKNAVTIDSNTNVKKKEAKEEVELLNYNLATDEEIAKYERLQFKNGKYTGFRVSTNKNIVNGYTDIVNKNEFTITLDITLNDKLIYSKILKPNEIINFIDLPYDNIKQEGLMHFYGTYIDTKGMKTHCNIEYK